MNNSITQNKKAVAKRSNPFQPQKIESWFDDFISGVSGVVEVAAKIIPLIPAGEKLTDPDPCFTGPIHWEYGNGIVTARNWGTSTVNLCFTTGIEGDFSNPISLDSGNVYDATGDFLSFPSGLITVSAAGNNPNLQSVAWTISDLVFPETEGESKAVDVTSDIALFTGYDNNTGYYISLKSAKGANIQGSMAMMQAEAGIFNTNISSSPVTLNVLPPGIELTENLILSSLAINLQLDTESYNATVVKARAGKK